MQNAGTFCAYVRVATEAQELSSQVAQRKAAGCVAIFREKISGVTTGPPELKRLVTRLTTGEIVVIQAVDRLSRDSIDLLVIARDMQGAGAGLRSLAEPTRRPLG